MKDRAGFGAQSASIRARSWIAVLGAVWLSAASAAAQAPSTNQTGADAEIAHVTAPVLLDGETLFRVRGTPTFPADPAQPKVVPKEQWWNAPVRPRETTDGPEG